MKSLLENIFRSPRPDSNTIIEDLKDGVCLHLHGQKSSSRRAFVLIQVLYTVLYLQQFDWYCSTSNGGSCLTYDTIEESEKKSLEEVTDKNMWRNPELAINGDLLPPGDYVFTLIASKGRYKSESNASVSIISDEIPTIEILSPDRLVKPFKKFVATALITGNLFLTASMLCGSALPQYNGRSWKYRSRQYYESKVLHNTEVTRFSSFPHSPKTDFFN